MCCSHTCQFSVIAALPPPFLLPPLPSSPPSLPCPFLALPLPLSFLWIASLLILIAYALPCLSYLLPPPILSYLFLPYIWRRHVRAGHVRHLSGGKRSSKWQRGGV